jgi:hypothetical protein
VEAKRLHDTGAPIARQWNDHLARWCSICQRAAIVRKRASCSILS